MKKSLSLEELAERKRMEDFVKDAMEKTSGFEITKKMTNLFLFGGVGYISSASIVSSSLAKEMKKPSTSDTVKRYFDVPNEVWNFNYFYFLWERIVEENILLEDIFYIKREGEMTPLVPIWEFVVRIHNGEIETTPYEEKFSSLK